MESKGKRIHFEQCYQHRDYMTLDYTHKNDIIVIANLKGVAIQCTPIRED